MKKLFLTILLISSTTVNAQDLKQAATNKVANELNSFKNNSINNAVTQINNLNTVGYQTQLEQAE